MKKVVVLFFGILALAQSWAQDTTRTGKSARKDWSKVSMANRPKDHFLIQVGYGSWTKKPDSIAVQF